MCNPKGRPVPSSGDINRLMMMMMIKYIDIELNKYYIKHTSVNVCNVHP
jgi:hypothetical protein